MIDLHCHILPGVDDGPKTISESIAMAKAAVSQGIHTIVATPHHKNGKYNNERFTVIQSVAALNEELKKQDIKITILPGQEIRLYGELLEDYETENIVSLNESNKYILVEFPSNHVPRYAESLFYKMQLKGLVPVIAHPERNAEIIEKPDILYNFINKGALSQLTAASVVGDFGKKIKKFSMQLIEHHLAHMVVSDAHNLEGRSFKLQDAYSTIQTTFGEEVLYQFQDTAYNIIAGHSLYRTSPERIRVKRFLGLF